MENIREIISEIDGSVSILIDKGNSEYTSMTKTQWDIEQAAKEASGTLS